MSDEHIGICRCCNMEFEKETYQQKLCSVKCFEEYYEMKYYAGDDLTMLHNGKEPLFEETEEGKKILQLKNRKKFHNLCEYCGIQFESAYPETDYCSLECRRKIELGKEKKVYDEKIEYIKIFVAGLIDKALEGGNRKQDGQFVNYYYISGFNDTVKGKILSRDEYRCRVCGSYRSLHIHHIVPRKLGGSHEEDNLVTLCARCHGAIETMDKQYAIKKCIKNTSITETSEKNQRVTVKDYIKTGEVLDDLLEYIKTDRIKVDDEQKAKIETLMQGISENLDKLL